MKKRAFGKLYRDLFCIQGHEKLSDKVFRCRMVVYLLTILACLAVMVSSTLALFYMDVSTENSTIESAYYSVTVDNTENGVYNCALVPDDKHTFKINAGGSATTGYCKIRVGEQVYYTKQIPHGSSLTLTIQVAKDTPIIFTPMWGVSSNYINEAVCGNEIIHSVTPHAVYKIEPAAKLANIAAHYGVSEENILVYNDLLAVAVADDLNDNSAPLLTAGMKLKIPEADENVKPYKVPYATYIVEPTATLKAISAHYEISIEDIIAFNDMTNYGAGMNLKIPNADPHLPDYAVPYATYIVEPTAKIEDISDYYGISVADIMIYNNISKISVGRALNIPGVSNDIIPYAVPYATYIAEPTATLEAISAHYAVSIRDILAFNDMTRYDYGVGYELKIPNTTVRKDYAVPYAVYIMQDGATLENIAIHYGVSVDDISYYNNYPALTTGYKLKIPGVDFDYPVYNYVAPVPEPPASTDEAAQIITGNNDYTIITENTLMLSEADILFYEGKKYQQELDIRFTGIETSSGADGCQYFSIIRTNVEKLSLCLAVSENIEQGYLKIIIGENEYFTVQIKKGAYIRLDIVAPIGSEIRFEAYEGLTPEAILYGDNLKDDTDGNNPLLDHT